AGVDGPVLVIVATLARAVRAGAPGMDGHALDADLQPAVAAGGAGLTGAGSGEVGQRELRKGRRPRRPAAGHFKSLSGQDGWSAPGGPIWSRAATRAEPVPAGCRRHIPCCAGATSSLK